MFVVPLTKDLIMTSDGYSYRVIEYTNFKDAGPAVYVLEKGVKTPKLVYFADIASLNGVKVEYSKQSKLLKTFGRLDREFHLPQPDDSITAITDTVDAQGDDTDTYEVMSIKLKSRSAGPNKGLVVKVDSDVHPYVRLSQILDICRSIGSSNFNRKEFQAIYKDYMGA